MGHHMDVGYCVAWSIIKYDFAVLIMKGTTTSCLTNCFTVRIMKNLIFFPFKKGYLIIDKNMAEMT